MLVPSPGEKVSFGSKSDGDRLDNAHGSLRGDLMALAQPCQKVVDPNT